MAAFPSIKPTERSFTLGEYPTKTYRALSGKVIRRSFGNRPFGATLELVFENVTETVLKQIFDHYHAQQGTSAGFVLPNAVFAGLEANSTLLAQLKAGTPSGGGMQWFYAETPSVESVYRNLSTISVSLICEFV